jgi:apolipoprotein N-acyltransferase
VEVFTTTTVVSVAWVVAGALIFMLVTTTQGPPVRVAAIQVGPGLGIDAAGVGADTPESRAVLARMSKEAAARGAKLAVWGEHILGWDPRKDPEQFVQRTARETGMYLVVGWSEGEGWTASNVVGLWDPKGDLVGVYYKIHPVIMAGEGFEQPIRYPVFETDLGPISMIICFDFSFEAPARQMANGGARLMAAAVEDWSGFAPMRIATVSLRAAENRVPFIKSEVLNASAIVDATGTVLAKADMGWEGGQALLVADVPLGPIDAPFSNLGPLFGYLCVFLLAMRVLFQVRLEWIDRRRRSAPAPERAH